jgi:hypothetical protein
MTVHPDASQQRARELIAKARATNAQRDQGEASAGWATPLAGPVDLSIRTIICALMAGIVTSDWNAVAEGYAMLCDLHEKIAGRPYDPILGRGDQ